MTAPPPNISVEAKIVVLGFQNVGKTSLVHRYVKNAFIPPSKAQSTIGASFYTTTVQDPETGTTIRLQIWDTAGQERFRSISKLYYRGAHAAILCYDVTSAGSFEDMGRWLTELRDQCGVNGALGDMIIHIVGTKSDIAAADPRKREVPFEKCIEYVSSQLHTAAGKQTIQAPGSAHGLPSGLMASPNSNRSSGFWGTDSIWDCCHEVSSKDGEGVEEVFRVITRKLVDQHLKRVAASTAPSSRGKTPGIDGNGQQGYFDLPNAGSGSFRVGYGDKRRSWLGLPMTPGGFTSIAGGTDATGSVDEHRTGKGRCC